MKGHFLLGLAILLFCAGLATAQDTVELTADYSYYRFNAGLPSLAKDGMKVTKETITKVDMGISLPLTETLA
jgi:hypothetical protein